MKRKSKQNFILVVVALLTGGCLATDPPTDTIELPDLVTFQTVEVGATHSCGLTLHNEAFCWGENGDGQLGTGDDVFRAFPWPVSQGTKEFSRISLGLTHSCAVTPERDTYCWGANDVGQLGLGSISELQVPAPAEVGGGREYTSVSVGGAHSCALTSSGSAFCWGYGSAGQLGNGDAGAFPRPSPDSVIGGLSFDVISAGGHHTCGLTIDSDAFCWGLGQDGRLGVGSTANEAEPTPVVNNLKFSHISAGVTHTCALALDGTAYCWGDGETGQLGTGGLGGSEVPVPVVGGLLFQSISAGGGFSCGVTSAGDAYCWGRNETGQLGDGTFEGRVQPTPVAGGLTFQTVSAGMGTFSTATCGLASDGIVYCWGDGRRGQTGTGDQIVVNSPIRVFGQAG